MRLELRIGCASPIGPLPYPESLAMLVSSLTLYGQHSAKKKQTLRRALDDNVLLPPAPVRRTPDNLNWLSLSPPDLCRVPRASIHMLGLGAGRV
jgi:hypothetical protein